jgi:23S rRNA (uracil1939-C5)-methyltransferase
MTNLSDLRLVTIESLAHGGDGIAMDDGQKIFVPYGLPGDKVRIKINDQKSQQVWGRILDVVETAPLRITPPCVHCFDCGGCALQHMRLDAYQAWKRDITLERLKRAGMTPKTLHDYVAIAPKTRRRAEFAVKRERGKVVVGFNRNHADHVVDIKECHVVIDAITAILPSLRTMMDILLTDTREADVSVTQLDTGLDVLITAPLEMNLLMHEALGEFVASHDIARISLRANDRNESEILLQPKPAKLTVGGVVIDPAPGSFLQPSRDGEQALINAVMRGAAGAKNIIDLFSGLGTFTFPLSKQAKVHAVDVDGPGVRAMVAAMGGRDITFEARNLYREPISGAMLRDYDAIVFDPPRAGAKGQAKHIVDSGVPLIIAVSCNPASFVTDCAGLLDEGYTLTDLTIIDQFVWTSHVEVVGIFKQNRF